MLGVATTVSAIHMKLPHHVSSYLSIDTFSGQKATELMTKVVEEVVIDDAVPFKLGGGCLELLLEIFLFSDFSVKKFLSAYKVVKHELQGGNFFCCHRFLLLSGQKLRFGCQGISLSFYSDEEKLLWSDPPTVFQFPIHFAVLPV